MSDNPYERDTPDHRPVEPETPGPQERSDDDGGTPTGPSSPDTPGTPEAPGTTRTFDTEPVAASPSADTAPVPVVPSDAAGSPDQRTEPVAPADDAVTSTFDVRDAERTQTLRTHQVERPVPRSGLAEHRSAGYLTGDRDRAQPDTDASATREDGTAPVLAGATAATGATAGHRDTGPADDAPPPADEPARSGRAERDVVLDGATAHTRPPSRAKAHVWAVLLTLLLTPVAWYLLADAGARLTLPQGNPWDTGNLNVAALLELGGGLLVLVVILLVARWSSVGAIVTGALVIVVGVPFVAVPTWTQELLEPVESWLAGLDDFGANVAHHLVASGSTGRLVVLGVALVLVGVVSHGARRQGRREVRPAVDA